MDVSVVVPTRNEEITIKQFLEWCFEGFNRSGLQGEVILLDNSDDRTPEIALANGARVIKVPLKGLGNAYAAGRSAPNGKWIIMGDADCTYDFRNIGPFIEKLRGNFDFVIGNRFIGEIEKGAMPPHHQYFGSPLTSMIFKHGLGLPAGDIHCGMRAMTKDLYLSLPFLEGGWEYATEMIVSARNLEAKIVEIPIKFFKEPPGRISHHKRSSWLSPFRAGWGTLRVTATYLIDRVFVVPGLTLLLTSSATNLLVTTFREWFLKNLNFGLLAQSVLMFASSVGAFMFTTGLLSRFAYRRKLSSLNFLAKSKVSSRLFSTLVIATIGELLITLSVFVDWAQNLNSKLSEIVYDSFFTSLWLSFTSLYLCILSISIASLIGNHAQKFR
jgi:glycosyltransferase involved in cell wall biosynthesis